MGIVSHVPAKDTRAAVMGCGFVGHDRSFTERGINLIWCERGSFLDDANG